MRRPCGAGTSGPRPDTIRRAPPDRRADAHLGNRMTGGYPLGDVTLQLGADLHAPRHRARHPFENALTYSSAAVIDRLLLCPQNSPKNPNPNPNP